MNCYSTICQSQIPNTNYDAMRIWYYNVGIQTSIFMEESVGMVFYAHVSFIQCWQTFVSSSLPKYHSIEWWEGEWVNNFYRCLSLSKHKIMSFLWSWNTLYGIMVQYAQAFQGLFSMTVDAMDKYIVYLGSWHLTKVMTHHISVNMLCL